MSKCLVIELYKSDGDVNHGCFKSDEIKTVGLCHSVQVCVPELFEHLGIADQYDLNDFQWKIAGINHMAFLLEITKNGRFYPTFVS